MKVRMRTGAVIFSIALSACVCSPSTPQSVTLRLKNTSPGALYVDQSDGRLGMVVQRNIGGQYVSFDESPPCACQACDQICDVPSCSCPAPDGMVARVAAGDSAERTWSGVVQISGSAACGGFGGTACLSPDNAPYNETFNLHLCYSLSAPGVQLPDDGGSAPGTLPSDAITCADKEFRIEDGVVEISPARGADCVTTADCKGFGELCFSGACTAACPENGYPILGQRAWTLAVGVTPMDFFDVTTDSNGRTVATGAGSITSAAYTGNTVTVQLARTGSAGETLRGTLSLTVPPDELGPLAIGTGVSVKAIQDTASNRLGNQAVLIRATDDGGTLLVAADTAQTGALLTAADLAPFKVTFNDDVIGCTTSAGNCGKVLYNTTSFTLGTKTVKVEPGASANIVDVTGTFRAVNVYAVANGPVATCDPADIRSYLIWRDKAPGTP